MNVNHSTDGIYLTIIIIFTFDKFEFAVEDSEDICKSDDIFLIVIVFFFLQNTNTTIILIIHFLKYTSKILHTLCKTEFKY